MNSIIRRAKGYWYFCPTKIL